MSLGTPQNAIKMTICDLDNDQKQFSMIVDKKGEMVRKMWEKTYWDCQISIGRSVCNNKNDFIDYLPSMKTNNSISRKHVCIDFSMAFKSRFVHYEFLLFERFLQNFLPAEIIFIIFSYYKLPHKVKAYSGENLGPYIRVQDLGSIIGTYVKTNCCQLEDKMKFSLAGELFKIKKVENKGFLNFTVNSKEIDPKYVMRIHPFYAENLEIDFPDELIVSDEFPYVMCKVSGTYYIFVATDQKLEFTIGRELHCDIYLDAPSISRCQNRVVYNRNSQTWGIFDGKPNRSSLNGSFVLVKSKSHGEKSDWHVMNGNELQIANYKISLKYVN